MGLSATNVISTPAAQRALLKMLLLAEGDTYISQIEFAIATLALTPFVPGTKVMLEAQNGVAIEAARARLGLNKFDTPEKHTEWINQRLKYFGAVSEMLGRENRALGEPAFNSEELHELLFNFIPNCEDAIGLRRIKSI